ncbi:MAG: GFA family protein [Gammaproteobacteria bacterium]|nr:GFA family protein [Gammaproteobacteria bacterium]MDH5302979.1 GFA family protein [Gammaproteobacteria bacterium]MDH5321274.1 GFA family protein [Gammaproteobacteria bacterium]
MVLRGGCHCGNVRFEVEAAADIEAQQCNCSICQMNGYLHLIVAKRNFRLLSGDALLRTYQFGSEVARHYFCRDCGIKSFYVPRSHPDGISVNVNCLERNGIRSVTVVPFDGQNWEQNIHKLSPISD